MHRVARPDAVPRAVQLVEGHDEGAQPQSTLSDMYFVSEIAVRVLGLWAAVYCTSAYFEGINRSHYLLATAIYLPVTLAAMQDRDRAHWVFGATQIDLSRVVMDCLLEVLSNQVFVSFSLYLLDQKVIPQGSSGDLESEVSKKINDLAKKKNLSVRDIYLAALTTDVDHLVKTSFQAFIEEFMCRGVLQEFFENICCLCNKYVTPLSLTTQKDVANVAQAILFSIAHRNKEYNRIFQLIKYFSTFVSGLYFGSIRNRDLNIYSSTISHSVGNLLAFHTRILNLFIRHHYRYGGQG